MSCLAGCVFITFHLLEIKRPRVLPTFIFQSALRYQSEGKDGPGTRCLLVKERARTE